MNDTMVCLMAIVLSTCVVCTIHRPHMYSIAILHGAAHAATCELSACELEHATFNSGIVGRANHACG
jgi:hypothetical protein